MSIYPSKEKNCCYCSKKYLIVHIGSNCVCPMARQQTIMQECVIYPWVVVGIVPMAVMPSPLVLFMNTTSAQTIIHHRSSKRRCPSTTARSVSISSCCFCIKRSVGLFLREHWWMFYLRKIWALTEPNLEFVFFFFPCAFQFNRFLETTIKKRNNLTAGVIVFELKQFFSYSTLLPSCVMC